MELTTAQRQFVSDLALQGARHVFKRGYPIAAMIACGAFESGFGTSAIYRLTRCPFNLQKPAAWAFPICPVLTQTTAADREGKKIVKAPFCIASDPGDAARIFCEWIEHWPNPGARNVVVSQRNHAKGFARMLPFVGFGVRKAGGPSPGDEYAALIDDIDDAIPYELLGEDEP